MFNNPPDASGAPPTRAAREHAGARAGSASRGAGEAAMAEGGEGGGRRSQWMRCQECAG
ncbi:MAG TPA: hypothetical protein HA257_06170 [Candidatus Methanoperedenaceae archaeon]|nr:hypothetical protein [Candidatus Methanoperedenaceae archaeon]